MIPESIFAKPATNRSVSEVPPGTESTSTGQLLNNDGFHKALQKQAPERAPQGRKLFEAEHAAIESPGTTPATSPGSEARPESARQIADLHGAASESDGNVESPDVLRQSDDSQPADQNLIARSDARDDSIASTGTESENASQDSQSVSNGSSRQVLRIDQATPTVAEPLPDAEQRAQTTVPDFASTGNSHPGTLPSLIRRPLEQVSVNQFLGNFVFDGFDANAPATGNLPSLPFAPVAGLSAEVDLVVRPFLNDALLPDDHHTVKQDFPVTATEPSLNRNFAANAESLSPDVLTGLHDLAPFPTLPSLRPDVELSAQVASDIDAAAVQLFNGADPESTAGIEVLSVEVDDSGAMQRFDIQPNGHVIVETTLPPALETFSPTETLSPEVAPLVLPSLSTEVNRTTLTSTAVPIQQIVPTPSSTSDSSAKPDRSAPITAPSPASGTEVAELEAVPNSSRQPTVAVPPQNIAAVVVPEQTDVAAGTLSRDASAVAAASVPTVEAITESVFESLPARPDSRAQRPQQTTDGSATDGSATNAVSVGTSSLDTVSGGTSAAVTPVAATLSNATDGEIPHEQVAGRPANSAASTVQESSAAVRVENSDQEVRIESVPQPNDDRPSTASETTPASATRAESEHARESNGLDRAAGTSSEQVPAATNNPVTNQDTPDNHRADSNTPAATRPAVPLSGAESPETGTNERHDDSTNEPPAAENQTGNAAAQSRRPANSTSIQPGSVPETPAPELSNNSPAVSSAKAVESSSVVTSSATVETQSTNIVTSAPVSSQASSAPAATPGSVSQASPIREPTIPMEIQDAVSAIQEATSGDGHIRVRLNPRELGSMLVDVSRVAGGIVARLEVESVAAQVAVLETLPDLQQSLSRSGATVDRVEVVLTETRSESGRQDGDQSQPRDQQQSRQDRQSSEQRQARDEQNQRRQQRDELVSAPQEDSPQDERPEELDITL